MFVFERLTRLVLHEGRSTSIFDAGWAPAGASARRPQAPWQNGYARSFAGIFMALILCVCFGHDDSKNHRLAFRDEAPLAAGQLGEQRQFQPLHDRLNSSQMMAVNGNLVRDEDQLEMLFAGVTGEFREDELIVRQQQRTPRRNLNA